MMTNANAHVPDILDTISNLSNDEVFTPPDVANEVLDLLPSSVWSDSTLRFLDPASKTGIFLREAARRLMEGLAHEFPDEEARREHIFKNMLFGFPITELTGLMSRRSVYYSKDASGEHSVIRFDDEQGNIPFVRFEHTYASNDKCTICGSPREQLERGEGRENYAYRFIHDKEVKNMKFDVVIGNPPYQLESGGHAAQAVPIYHLFVEQAFRLKPRYVAMITPSRWFAGGMGLDAFRQRMLDSRNFRNLVDFPAAAELFPTVEIKGGVSYWLWDRDYDGDCEVVRVNQGVRGNPSHRLLGEHGDVFVRFNEAIPILQKVQSKDLGTIESWVSQTNPFGIATNFKDYQEKNFEGSLGLYGNGGKYYIQKTQVPSNTHWVEKWKVLTSKGYNGGDAFPHKIIGDPILAEPGSVCSMTYIIAASFDYESEARNFASFLQTKFARFLIALRKNTQHITRSSFKFVPELSMDKKWTDEELFEYFGLTQEEQDFISSIVRETTSEDSAS